MIGILRGARFSLTILPVRQIDSNGAIERDPLLLKPASDVLPVPRFSDSAKLETWSRTIAGGSAK